MIKRDTERHFTLLSSGLCIMFRTIEFRSWLFGGNITAVMKSNIIQEKKLLQE